MSPFINAAKQQLVRTLEELAKKVQIDLNVGIVEYRDHPADKMGFVTKVHHFQKDLDKLQKAIQSLTPFTGHPADTPEAVLDGLKAAFEKLHWRPRSCRFIILVGDAPPHAYARWAQSRGLGTNFPDPFPDHFPEQCPSDLTIESATVIAEQKLIKIYSMAMGRDQRTLASFEVLASATGGMGCLADASTVIKDILSLLDAEMKDLVLDEKVLDAVTAAPDFDAETLATTLGCTRYQAASSLGRLGRRGFLS